MAKSKNVSPVNGQPVPRGRPFTSETARQARQKRAEKEHERKSITEAFKKLLTEEFFDESTGKTRTGAEMLALSILNGALNGNGKMVEIALALIDESPLPPDAW